MSAPTTQIISAAAIRQEFEDLVRRDLLGPAGGEQEIITEQSVRNRYLLGMLAPLKGTEVEEDTGELADDTGDNAEEGKAEPSTPVKHGTTPSTFGFSFCLGVVETEFEVQARWGQYVREQDPEGKPVWKRYPRGGAKKIPLAEGNVPEWSPEAESPQVTVRGRIRRRADHWSVTLFLSNEQEEGRPRDVYWLFQAQLEVCGSFSRRPGQGHVSTLDEISRLEDQTNEMLYGREVEFARGHGISVEWELGEESWDHAIAIRTAAMPRTIVRTVQQQEVPGLITDMKALAEAGDADFAGMLRPLATAYRQWIEELDARRIAESDLAAYAEAATQVIDRARQVLQRLQDGITLLEINEDARHAFRFANQAMWQQRVRSVWIDLRKSEPASQLADVDIPKNRSWRAFQLAFILMNLPGLSSLDHADRGTGPFAGADLLWFPTGGGKNRSVSGAGSLRDGDPASSEERRRARWRERCRSVDAVHAPVAHVAAVPARGHSDVRLRADPPCEQEPLGRDSVPVGPLGGAQDHPESHQPIGRSRGSVAEWKAAGVRRRIAAPVSGLPVVRNAD